MQEFLDKLAYTNLLSILQTLFRIIFALALPIFIGTLIVRLFFIIIGKPLNNKRMPLIGIIISLIIGLAICMAIPYLRNIEMSFVKYIQAFRWDELSK